MRLNSTPLHVKRADPAQGRFTALASTFELDRVGDRVEPGAFEDSLAAFQTRGARIPLLWNHDTAEPIGAIESARETADGLEVDAVIALDSARGREAYALLKTGGLALSIGYTLPEDSSLMVDGVRVISAIDLAEISVVAVPANPGAVVRSVKALYPTARDLERALREQLGFTHREAKRLLSGGFEALAGAPDEPDTESLLTLRASLANLTKAFIP